MCLKTLMAFRLALDWFEWILWFHREVLKEDLREVLKKFFKLKTQNEMSM